MSLGLYPSFESIAKQIAEEEGLHQVAKNYGEVDTEKKDSSWRKGMFKNRGDSAIASRDRRIYDLQEGIKRYVMAVRESFFCDGGQKDETGPAFIALEALVEDAD